jgi:RNA polymerase sigma-70 factor (ECF subfamily)
LFGVESSERRLIEQCLAGEAEAFGDLIAPYQDRIYNTLYRMSGHREDAAELFQEAMVRVYRGLRSYQGDSAFYTWLYRIVLNVAFTDRRRKKSRPIATESISTTSSRELAQPDSPSGPGHHVEIEETRGIIEQALGQVAEPYRVVLVLKDIDGLKYEEIAEILDVPIGTVRSRLHRARSEMRDRLQPYLDRGTI